MKYIINITWLLLLFVIIMSSNSFAQSECGTTLEQTQIDYMNNTRSDRGNADIDILRNTVTVIPLVAHIIRDSNGQGGLSMSDLQTSLDQLSTTFQQVEFEFDLCNVNYIDNDNYFDGITYSLGNLSEEYFMATPDLVSGAVNIFYVPVISACGWSSFPSYLDSYQKDWTVINNSCATNGSTLAHEIGHYFNLYHTHECEPACELVDGSNCGPNVGDELCDTPADPNLNGCVNNSCFYTCTINTDANGDFYNPDTNNVMSYSQKQCRTFFSPEQIDRMYYSYLYDRNFSSACKDIYDCEDNLNITDTYINGDDEYFEVFEWITSTATVNTGADITYDAGNYIYLNPNFIADNGSVFLAKIDGCDNDPEGLVEGESEKLESTKTGQIAMKNYPNPFTGQTTIEFTLLQDTPVTLTVSDVTGRQIAVLLNSEQQPAGTHQVTFDGNAYPTGMYYYTIQAGQYVGTEKMTLTK